MEAEKVPYRNPAGIQDYKELTQSFRSWVPDVLSIREIEAELETLAKTERELRGLRPTRGEFQATLQASCENYRRRHIERVAKFLSENLTARDPLSRLERLNHLIPPFIPMADFLEAETMLPDEIFGTAPDKKRAAELRRIGQHRAELEARRVELCPPPFLRLDRMGTARDVRVLFVQEWESKQRVCREPCDPCGLGLKYSDDDTRWAYSELGLSAYVNEKNGKLAAVP